MGDHHHYFNNPGTTSPWRGRERRGLPTLLAVGSLRGLLGQLSVDPHVRGQQFELISQWFFRNTPLYQAELRGVWLWRQWPGRWG